MYESLIRTLPNYLLVTTETLLLLHDDNLTDKVDRRPLDRDLLISEP